MNILSFSEYLNEAKMPTLSNQSLSNISKFNNQFTMGVEFEFVYKPKLPATHNSYNLPTNIIPASYKKFLNRTGIKYIEERIIDEYKKTKFTFYYFICEPFIDTSSKITDNKELYAEILNAIASEYEALEDKYSDILIQHDKKYTNIDIFMKDLYSFSIDFNIMKILLKSMESNLYNLSGLDKLYNKTAYLNTIDIDDFFENYISDNFNLDLDQFINHFNLKSYLITPIHSDKEFAAKYYRRYVYSTIYNDVNKILSNLGLSKYAIVDSVYSDSDKRFIIKSDSSIQTNNSEIGIEISTPALPFGDCVSVIKSMFDYIQVNGDTNQSCGFHINLSFTDKGKFDRIDWIKLAMFLYDPYILKFFGRDDNRYTSSQYKNLMRTISNHIQDVYKYISDVNLGNNLHNYDVKNTISALNDSKYTSINIKDGYIEFRIAGGKYHDKYTTIMNLIYRYCTCMNISINPSIYKSEYIKKLYKYSNSVNNLKSELQIILQSIPEFNIYHYIKSYNTVSKLPIQIIKFLSKYYTPLLGIEIYKDVKKIPVNIDSDPDSRKTSDGLKLNFLLSILD